MKKCRSGKKYLLLTTLLAGLGFSAAMSAGAEESIIKIETEASKETEVQIGTDVSGETQVQAGTEDQQETQVQVGTEMLGEFEVLAVPEQTPSDFVTEITPIPGITIPDFIAGKDDQTDFRDPSGENYTMNKPVLLKAYAKSNTSAKLTWERVEHAQGYVVYRKAGSGHWKRIKTLQNATKLSYTDKSLKKGKTYSYRIRAYRMGGKKRVYSEFSRSLKIKTKTPTVKGNYKKGSVYGPVSSKKQLAQVRRVAQSFKDNYIRAGMSDWEKAQAVFNYVRNTCDYTWENWTQKRAGSAWGALVEGKAHCGGYSRAVKVLCDAIGLKCYYVHASSTAFNPTHRWNLVEIEGVWYVLDSKDGVFLAGTDTFCEKMGMTWVPYHYPTCSTSDHEQYFVTTREG